MVYKLLGLADGGEDVLFHRELGRGRVLCCFFPWTDKTHHEAGGGVQDHTTPACYLITVVEVHLLGLMKLNKPEICRSLYRPMRKLISSELLKSEQSIMFLLCKKKIILWLNFQPPFITLACTDGGSFCASLGWREQFVFVSYHLFRCFFFFIYLCFLFYLLRVCMIYFPFLLIGRFFLPLILLDL